jgi:hypothetical protein
MHTAGFVSSVRLLATELTVPDLPDTIGNQPFTYYPVGIEMIANIMTDVKV